MIKQWVYRILLVVWLIGMPVCYTSLKLTMMKMNEKYNRPILFTKADKFACIGLSFFSWIGVLSATIYDATENWENEPA